MNVYGIRCKAGVVKFIYHRIEPFGLHNGTTWLKVHSLGWCAGLNASDLELDTCIFNYSWN